MEHCSTCKHWTPYIIKHPNGYAKKDERDGGFCGNDKITEDLGRHNHVMLVYSYNEGGEFWTGPDFGCVNHTEASLA